MSSRRLKPSDLPDWPRGLSRELAAAYVGVSVNTFLQEVDDGIWPEAKRRGGRVIWDRAQIDSRFDQLSGRAHRPSGDDELLRRAEKWGG